MSDQQIDPYQPCPCGSGNKYKFCCREKEKAIDQGSPRSLIQKSTEYPVYECRINEDWQEKGLATIFVLRQLPNLKYIFGTYLVDILCMGLKNTFCNANMPYSTIERMMERAHSPLIHSEYEDSRSIILGGIEYAKGLGFNPNRDWEDSKHIVEPERPFHNKFTFGKDGKPIYIPGPDDNPTEIMSKLSAALNKSSRETSILKRMFGARKTTADAELDFIIEMHAQGTGKTSKGRPIPKTEDEWFAEIVDAYHDAAETKPFGIFVGKKITPSDYFHVAPAVCFKFRGIPRDKERFQAVTETVLSSHVANVEQLPEIMGIPQMRFAFAYLASHFALDLMDEEVTDRLMRYIEENQSRMITLTKTC